MGDREPAGSGVQPGAHAVTAPRLAVVLDVAPDASRVCRVDAPDRVMRIWGLLSDAHDELRQVSLPPGAAARLQRQLDAVTAELERSVSPALAGELRQLTRHRPAVAPTADELRVEYASLVAWTGGLVIGMLSELEAASSWQAPRGRLSSLTCGENGEGSARWWDERR